jgi:hypothetical protein
VNSQQDSDQPLVKVRRRALTIETIHHEFGPESDPPIRLAASSAVVANPYAGRYVEDLSPFMTALRALGTELATELVGALGGAEQVEAYGKAAIVGVN